MICFGWQHIDLRFINAKPTENCNHAIPSIGLFVSANLFCQAKYASCPGYDLFHKIDRIAFFRSEFRERSAHTCCRRLFYNLPSLSSLRYRTALAEEYLISMLFAS